MRVFFIPIFSWQSSLLAHYQPPMFPWLSAESSVWLKHTLIPINNDVQFINAEKQTVLEFINVCLYYRIYACDVRVCVEWRYDVLPLYWKRQFINGLPARCVI